MESRPKYDFTGLGAEIRRIRERGLTPEEKAHAQELLKAHGYHQAEPQSHVSTGYEWIHPETEGPKLPSKVVGKLTPPK